jgi:hypothetical protein
MALRALICVSPEHNVCFVSHRAINTLLNRLNVLHSWGLLVGINQRWLVCHSVRIGVF